MVVETAGIQESSQESFGDVLLALEALPDWINRSCPVLEGLRFNALPINRSLHDAPTVSVEVSGGDGLVAIYKYNFQLEPTSAVGIRLVLSPLVIMWAEGGVRRTSGMDGIIIRHCLESIGKYKGSLTPSLSEVILTTGYLTVQRAGRVFFEKLGWVVTDCMVREGAIVISDDQRHLRATLERIACLSRETRTLDIERASVCIAWTHIETI